MKMQKKLLLIVLTLGISSCTGTIPQRAVLELPPAVTCPKFTEKELVAVNDSIYAKIVELDIICNERIPMLRNIIKSTN